jgi:hypothetical protein
LATEVVRTASPIDQRRELLDREKGALGVQVEHLGVDGFGHAPERHWNAKSGVDERLVEGVELGLHLSGEGVDVHQRPRVARNHDSAVPKLLPRRLQAGLRAAGHQNARAPVEEHLRRREPHAARAANNHCLFILVSFHADSPCDAGGV